MREFARVKRLPPYILNEVNQLKAKARARHEDIIDFGMGNPDQATPPAIVEKLIAAAKRDHTHRYSVSKGIPRLRQAICHWYADRYQVNLDPATQAIVTIGSKQALALMALAYTGPGDSVLVPNPAYPIHTYAFIIAGADIRSVQLSPDTDFFENLDKAIRESLPKPRVLVLSFPANPTTHCVELDFFEKVIALAKTHGIIVIHDLAYAEIYFGENRPPSILQVPGAKDIAVETTSLSKTYNMPGWRVGFVCGSPELIHNLSRLKSYFDYGTFTPIQVAAIEALEGSQDCVQEIRTRYQHRRDVLCDGLREAGWPISVPEATMFVWAKIPKSHQHLGSFEFSKQLLKQAKVAVSPGIGFGDYGDDYVRFSLIENEQRIRQAVRGIRRMLRDNASENSN